MMREGDEPDGGGEALEHVGIRKLLALACKMKNQALEQQIFIFKSALSLSVLSRTSQTRDSCSFQKCFKPRLKTLQVNP